MTPSDTPGTYRLLVESWHDRNDTRITLDRDHHGLPTALRHSGGYHLAIDTTGHRVTALRLLDHAPSSYDRHDPVAATGTVVVRYGYDEAGRLNEVINSSGEPLTFGYDDEDRITSWTDRNNTSFHYIYDDRGRVVRTEGTDGFLSGTFTYDDETRTTAYTDSLGHTSHHRCTRDGQVAAVTDPLGNTTYTEWDEWGHRPVRVTDPLGRTTSYTYDAVGNLASAEMPDGTTARIRYDTFLNLPTETTEPDGAVWRNRYDSRGNLLTSTDPLGAETRYRHDAAGHLTAVTDALGHTRHAVVNAAGLLIATTDELGNTTRLGRDTFGRITEITDPLGQVTRLGWTVEGWPAWRTHPDGTRETWSWDGEGNLLSHSDPAGHTTEHTVSHFDVPATRTDPDSGTYAFDYDTELRLTRVTNPQGRIWTYTYDAAGRLTSETDFGGRTLRYEHDACGNLIARTNGAGDVLYLSWDACDRLLEERRAGASRPTATYRYDAAGRLMHAANGDAEITFERDALGRVLAETVNDRATSYTYDTLGRRTRRVTPSGWASDWSYDPAGRPRELRSESGALSFAYDAAGHETERRIGDDTALLQTWDTMHHLTAQRLVHRPSGHATHSQVRSAGERLLQHRTYAYRPDDELTEIRDLTSGTRRFALDPMGRVTRVQAHGWHEAYVYDSVGNVVHASAPGHPSPGDRSFDAGTIRSAGRTSYAYDGEGRLVRRTRRLLNGQKRVWTYTWTDDRLTRVTTPDDQTWQYLYDPLGRRISKRRLSDDGSVAERSDFAWDETRLAEERTGQGAVTTWEYLPGTHRPVAQTDRRTLVREPGRSALAQLSDESAAPHMPRFHALVTDPVGTPLEMVTADGTLGWQYRTALWGTELPTEGSTDTAHCPLRFPGQYADAETGMHYNYARYYDPETARYTCRDPLGLAPAPNAEGYVGNPFTLADPLGLKCEKPRLSDPLPRGMTKKIVSAYDDYKAGRLTSHDVYQGREHPWWAGAEEYRVPGAADNERIVVKKFPNGKEAVGWTTDHYQKIHRFTAPHFPDWGWH
jgi:RHS repeat-associated protein